MTYHYHFAAWGANYAIQGYKNGFGGGKKRCLAKWTERIDSSR